MCRLGELIRGTGQRVGLPQRGLKRFAVLGNRSQIGCDGLSGASQGGQCDLNVFRSKIAGSSRVGSVSGSAGAAGEAVVTGWDWLARVALATAASN